MVAAFAVLAVKAHYGVLWGDEGFYLATSRALLVGGAPFRDDSSHAASWFFVVLTPVLALLPHGGTLVQVRLVGLALRFAAAGALFLAFRRHLPPWVLGAALAATLLASFPFLLVPSYNNVPFDALFASVAAWTTGAGAARRSRAIAWGSLAGALLALGVLCHLPRGLLLGLPLAVWLWSRGRVSNGLPGLGAASAACLSVSSGVVATAFALLAASGWLPDFVRALGMLTTSRVFGATLAQRVTGFLVRDAPRILGVAAAHGLFWGAALALVGRAAAAPTNTRRRVLAAAVGAVGLAYASSILYAYVHGERWFSAYYLIYPGLCWLPLCAYLPLRGTLRALGPTAACGAALLVATALPQQIVVTLTSTQRAGAGAPGVGASLLLLALMSVAWTARPGFGGAAAARWGARVVIGLCLALGASAAVFHFCPEENPLQAELAAFRTGRLAGVHTTEARVIGWSELSAYLSPRVARGETLLAYANVPLVYYVTDTRPALGATVVSSLLFTPAQQSVLVERMQARGGLPRYAVRLREGTLDEAVFYSRDAARDPIHALVRRRYRLEARLSLFDVLRRRDGPPRGVSDARGGGTPAAR